ncbi:MAG TPA: alkaline phosphatase family protein [Pseudolabrys sp.]|jgi:phospholipase C
MAYAAGFGFAVVSQSATAESLNEYKHIVVIYQENHSFDNLYGLWGAVNGQHVNGLQQADTAHTIQVMQNNAVSYACLLQEDVNLTSPPLASTCNDNGVVPPIVSAFTNQPFDIDNYIASTDKTCPPPNVFAANGVLKNSPGALAGGCTRDIVHRFYSEQYQINKGNQNRYVTGSDAAGLVMGHYDTTNLPIYKYLHSRGAPHYVIADNFFQGAFGGSFLNHQWLVAAASPVFANAIQDGSSIDLHSIVDTNGMPTNTPLYTPVGAFKDSRLTRKCDGTHLDLACGDFAVNTIQPTYQPFSPGTTTPNKLPPLTNPTIGDRLSAAGIDWAWYSGGWSNANGDVGAPGWTNGNGPNCSDPNAFLTATYPNCPDLLFQFHHQAFNYFANYAPGTAARTAHLRDEAEFIDAAKKGKLKPVSFVKPVGAENEHPGYASETDGSDHLVDLIKAVVNGPDGKNTLIIVTYDEFGGQWDHVPPPPYDLDDEHGWGDDHDGHRESHHRAPHDLWGPGTRIPALLVSNKFENSGVDHASHDTTSILRTIEERFHLVPLGLRDAQVTSLATALDRADSH